MSIPLNKNFFYIDFGEILFAHFFKVSSRCDRFRTARIPAAADSLRSEHRNMSQFSRDAVFSRVKSAVDIQRVSDAGSDIDADNIFLFCFIELVFQNVVVQEVIYVPVDKHGKP